MGPILLAGWKGIRRRYLIAAAVVLAVGATFAFATSSARSGNAVAFTTIPAQKLVAGGIGLASPQGSIPTAAAGDAAAKAASQAFGGETVLEYHYAYCTDSQAVPPLAENCWAVSLDPSGLAGGGTPHTGPASKASYLLVLIDPATDAMIEGASD